MGIVRNIVLCLEDVLRITMKVFKFGGASVKDADAVRNVASIIRLFPEDQLVTVVSAMGKTTNAMETVLESWMAGNTARALEGIAERRAFHFTILDDLSIAPESHLRDELAGIFLALEEKLNSPPSDDYDYEYDQLVSIGEVISTKIVAHQLQEAGVRTGWQDARQLIRTDGQHREARVDWDTTAELITEKMGPFFAGGAGPGVAVTQGFIGHTNGGYTTTLGREGSDFTGAILAWCLNGESLTIWKDVPGMLNADPKWFDNTVRLPKISYREAIELAYYGATVIHPKTIKPLQNKDIPLYVKSFVDPDADGTTIQTSTVDDTLIPSFIFKTEQLLISITPKDFSFIAEENLSDIFQTFYDSRVRMNLMQNSAINFSACVNTTEKIPGLLERLSEKYKVRYNEGLELITIRHYDDATIERVLVNKEILVEQKSRYTARFITRELDQPAI